jgi:ABC-type phosphate transport system permease subunit
MIVWIILGIFGLSILQEFIQTLISNHLSFFYSVSIMFGTKILMKNKLISFYIMNKPDIRGSLD